MYPVLSLRFYIFVPSQVYEEFCLCFTAVAVNVLNSFESQSFLQKANKYPHLMDKIFSSCSNLGSVEHFLTLPKKKKGNLRHNFS